MKVIFKKRKRIIVLARIIVKIKIRARITK
jgi:hypothetical protein